jgi:bla regulator protein BlaR1
MTATQWLEVVTSYSLQVLAVIAACKLIERAIAKTSDRCAIWSNCFLCILFLGCTALVLPRLHLIQPWSQLEPRTLVTVSATQDVVGRLLLAIWCIGMSVSLVRWFVRGQQLRRTLNRCERMPPLEVKQLLGQTNIGVAGQQLPVVLISDQADGPFCWQLHQPTVVLPLFLLEGSREDLRHVLLHELEHLTTNHPLQLFWQHLVQVVCWFHPAVWNAASRASLMREFTCDEAAANNGANSAAYLRTLLQIAERCERNRNSSAIGFGRTPSEIVLRARRLVNLSKDTECRPRRGFIGRKTATCILMGLTIAMSLIWIPSDPLASPRSVWSPWPRWTAKVAHCFGCNLRDYEQYDRHSQLFEIARQASNSSATTSRVESADMASN